LLNGHALRTLIEDERARQRILRTGRINRNIIVTTGLEPAIARRTVPGKIIGSRPVVNRGPGAP
jgi:hypothetical protein